MKVDIYEIDLSYYEAICQVWREAGLPIRPKGRDSETALEKQLQSGVVNFLGAFIEQELVGIVLLSHDSRKGWINRLAVKPQFQRQGIAKNLIQASEVFFERLGIEIVAVLIEEDKVNSLKLFREVGYHMWNGE
ncbi:MAG: GNAT family N-acetyltransferase, partial [Candidatus Hodarchaeota archaeon]